MKWTRIAVLAVIVGLGVVLSFLFDLPALLRQLLGWIDALGALGVVVFIAVYIAATVLFVPGSILTLGAGFVFGVLAGTVWVSIGSSIGALGAFLVGRYVARDWVARRTAGNPRFRAIDEAVGREGWKIVFLTRMSPIFPFNLSNYAYGLTGVSALGYFFASWIGMLPGTVMYVYFGSLAGNLATVGASQRQTGTLDWILYGLGFVATVAVTVFVTRLARRALNNTLETEQ